MPNEDDDDDGDKKDELLNLDSATCAVFAKKNYIIKKKLNQGHYGVVYKGIHTRTNVDVAIKVIRKLTPRYMIKRWPRELDALTNIRHEYVVRMYDIFQSGGKLFIIMEYANCGDINGYLKKYGRIGEELTCYWFTQCLKAMAHMHDEYHFAHRDLKADNVLLHNNKAKVTDFGFAIHCWNNKSNQLEMSNTYCGTGPYLSPQIVSRVRYSPFAADAWAMGVLLFNMLNRKFPFHHKERKQHLEEQSNADFLATRYTKQFQLDLEDLQKRFFALNEPDRITMAQALKHPWIVRKGKQKVSEKPSTP